MRKSSLRKKTRSGGPITKSSGTPAQPKPMRPNLARRISIGPRKHSHMPGKRPASRRFSPLGLPSRLCLNPCRRAEHSFRESRNLRMEHAPQNFAAACACLASKAFHCTPTATLGRKEPTSMAIRVVGQKRRWVTTHRLCIGLTPRAQPSNVRPLKSGTRSAGKLFLSFRRTPKSRSTSRVHPGGFPRTNAFP